MSTKILTTEPQRIVECWQFKMVLVTHIQTSKLLELQTFDGGFVNALLGSNEIRCEGLKVEQRYVVDLMGFFQ